MDHDVLPAIVCLPHPPHDAVPPGPIGRTGSFTAGD
jgi:hypothetical protein